MAKNSILCVSGLFKTNKSHIKAIYNLKTLFSLKESKRILLIQTIAQKRFIWNTYVKKLQKAVEEFEIKIKTEKFLFKIKNLLINTAIFILDQGNLKISGCISIDNIQMYGGR